MNYNKSYFDRHMRVIVRLLNFFGAEKIHTMISSMVEVTNDQSD